MKILEYQKLIKEFEYLYPKCKVTAFDPSIQFIFENQVITLPTFFIKYLVKHAKMNINDPTRY